MSKEHDVCADCIESADRIHDDVNCTECACKGCPWIHNCAGQCYGK